MSLKSAMKDMYTAHGKALEILRWLEPVAPQPGKLSEELQKEDTQKGFDKAKKRWKENLDRADFLVIDLDDALKEWDQKTESCNPPLSNAYKKFAEIQKAIESVVDTVEKNNELIKQAGGTPVKIENIQQLQLARDRANDAFTVYDDAKKEIQEEKKLLGDATKTWSDLKSRKIKANDELLDAVFIDLDAKGVKGKKGSPLRPAKRK